MARAEIAIAEDRAREGAAILRGLHRDAAHAGRAWQASCLAARLCVAWGAAGEPGEAAKALYEAVRALAPAGLCQPFLDSGPILAAVWHRMRENARSSVEGGALLPFVDTLIARHGEAGPDTAARRHGAPSADGLSPRERSVLALLGEGQSNKDIARALSIAPETVKSHVKNIFGKLGVERRAQAVSRALSSGPGSIGLNSRGPRTQRTGPRNARMASQPPRHRGVLSFPPRPGPRTEDEGEHE